MPFVPLPNTVRAELIFSWDGQQVENVYHIKTPNLINEAELDDIRDVLYLWWSTYGNVFQSNTVNFLKFVLSDASDQYGVSKEYAPGVIHTGAHGGTPPLPNNVSIAIKWNTGLRGRSYRGRTFHVGLCEGFVIGNSMEATVLAGLISQYTQLVSSLDGSGRQLVVASKFQGNAPRVTGVVTPILTVTCDGVIDSQRRRLPGRGK